MVRHSIIFHNSMHSAALVAGVFVLLVTVHTAGAATLSIEPPLGNHTVGEVFTVSIALDAVGESVDGVDIFKLNFDPDFLEVVDSDSVSPGIQITGNGVFPQTLFNGVGTSAGTITFSQVALPGTFVLLDEPVVLASITFRALQKGRADISFDFTPQSTSDTNVASGGMDVLTEAHGAS
jgi:hypothetical protein